MEVTQQTITTSTTTNATAPLQTAHLQTAPLQTDPSSSALLKGYLKKRDSPSVNDWQSRYFVFYPEHLSIVYYRNQEDILGHHKSRGHIDLKDIRTVEYRGGCEFHLLTHDKAYNLLAPTIAEKNLWVNCIRAVREALIDSTAARLDRSATRTAVETSLRDAIIITQKHMEHLERNNIHLDVNHEGVSTKTVETLSRKEVVDARTHLITDNVLPSHHVDTSFDPSAMREFLIVERTLGGLVAEKLYRFRAPRDSDVDIKFVKESALLHDHLATSNTKTSYSTLQSTTEFDRTVVDKLSSHNTGVQGYPGTNTMIESTVTAVPTSLSTSTGTTSNVIYVDESRLSQERL